MFKIKTFLLKTKVLKGIGVSSNLFKTYANCSRFRFSSDNKDNEIKDKFKKMMESQGISEEEVKTKREEEERKKKLEEEHAKQKYEQDSQKLKDRFSRLKQGIKDDEIEIDFKKLSNKFSSFLYTKKKKESDTHHESEKDKATSTESKKESKPKEEAKPKEEQKESKTTEKQEQSKEDVSDKEKVQEEKEKEQEKKEEKKETKDKRLFKNKHLNKFYTGFVDLWKQTFPGEENIELRMRERREKARLIKSLIKEPTEEEIEEAESKIPEWKRGAIVLVTANDLLTEKKSIFEQAKDTLRTHIRNSEAYSNYKNSNAYKDLMQFKADFEEARKNMKDELSGAQNPLLVASRDILDRVQFKSSSALATKVMRKYEPDFDLFSLENEVDEVLKQLLNAFMKDDQETVQKLSGDTALGQLTGIIRTRKEMGVECKYKEVLYIEKATYLSAALPEEDVAVFRFRINCQEINCLISKKEPEKIVQGDENHIESCQYVFDVTRNPEPEVEEFGHPWMIVGLERVGVVKQLV